MPVYKASHIVPVTSPPISDGAIAVLGDEIQAVGTAAAVTELFPNETVLDFGDSAIVPGFVNCHTHLELTGFRGQLDRFDHDFCKWLLEITRLRRTHDAADQIELSALFGACEAVSSGVTTVGDIARVGKAGVLGLSEVGLRGIVFQETEFSPEESTADKDFDSLREKFETLSDGCTGKVAAGLSPHAPYTVSRKLFELISRYSIDNEVPLSIHAAESQEETALMTTGGGVFYDVFFKDQVSWLGPGLSTVRYLSEIGVLDASPLLAHCIHVSEKELGLISDSGSRIAHCPKSNAKFGHGSAPLGRFLNSGIPVGFGTDSMASNNTCDLLEEARFAGLMSRVHSDAPEFVEPAVLFRLMTMGGAEALGLDDKIGSLEEGKQADFAVISVDGVGQIPVADIYSTLIFSTQAASVRSVMVGGDFVYHERQLLKVDIKRIAARVSEVFAH